MDRCALAYELHRKKNNCAQSVVGSFSDLTGLSLEQCMGIAAGFGGGVGGSHEELCGAVSGGVLTLGLLFPEDKRRCYALSKEFRRRFQEAFGRTGCRELLAARPGTSERTPAAKRLNAATHCNIMVVTAVELLEELLRDEENRPD